MLEQKVQGNHQALARELKNSNDKSDRKMREMESSFKSDMGSLDYKLNESIDNKINKALIGYDKKVCEDMAVQKHSLRELIKAGDDAIDKKSSDRINASIIKLERDIKDLLNVDQFVDNINYQDDEEAQAEGKFYHLSSWLADNNNKICD